jgi:hypothetical protein
MEFRRLVAVTVLLGAAHPSFAAEERYLCTEDSSTGFSFNKQTKQWGTANFKVSGPYVVARSTVEMWSKYKYVVTEMGSDGSAPLATCSNDFNEYGNLLCDGLTEFRFNRKRMRFLKIYAVGYWNDTTDPKMDFLREGTNTPAMAIGRCAKF